MRLIALCSLLVACSSTSEVAPVSAPKMPKVHRATATACPTERGAGFGLPGGAGACEKDSDCTAGKNGRCIEVLPAPSACSYDECFVDADCKSGVCDCRSSATKPDANRCFNGNCQVDADCDGGKGWCSGSGNDLSSSCEGPPLGSFGYFCRTSADECVEHAECGAEGRCMFDAEKLHWRCFAIMCAL